MKKLYILTLILLFSANAFAQSDSKIWIGIDGSYWQKSVKGGVSTDFDSEFSRNIRPMIGYQFNEKWSIGLITNFQKYRIDEGFGAYQTFDLLGKPAVSRPKLYNQATTNNLFGIGAFARRDFSLGDKFSFNLTFYSMRESGDEGNIERYFQIFSCPICFSIANPRIEPFSELNWRTGLDLAFAYQANNWLKMEIRANLLELRLQEITDPNPNLTNIEPNSYDASFQSFYANFTNFGSAVSRDGIRFGLVFTPF
jgi:hypothetical protein